MSAKHLILSHYFRKGELRPANPPTISTKIKGVDYRLDPQTALCMAMGSSGLAVSYISEVTKLPEPTVRYRLSLYGIKLKDYRRGRNSVAHKMVNHAVQHLMPLIERRVQDHLTLIGRA